MLNITKFSLILLFIFMTIFGFSVPTEAIIIENSIKIVKEGTIQGDEKSTAAALPATDTYVSYGGSSDLWGLGWTPANINASDFGVVFSAVGNSATSHYLKATNFGFSIPVEATIDGILVEIEQRYDTGPLNTAWSEVDHIRITVYYTGGAVERRVIIVQ